MIYRIDNGGYKMPDGVHITGLPAHQVTGSLLIIEGKIFLQQLPVYFAAHIIEQPLGCGLKGHLIGKTQNTGEKRHSQQAGYKLGEQIVILFSHYVIHNDAGYVRVDNG